MKYGYPTFSKVKNLTPHFLQTKSELLNISTLSSQTKILCKYFLLGQVLIFHPQERLLQLYLLQRVHGHLDGGQGDPAEGCPVHKVKQDFQTCLLKISNIIVERSNPHNFTFDYFSLYHYFIVDKLWFLFLVISLFSSHSKTIPLYRTVPTFIT